MTSRTAWVAGNGAGLTWTAAFNSTDFSTSYLTNGQAVLSTVAIANGSSNLDQFMDISVRMSISSSTIAAGANFAFWIAMLLDDGSTYGDGHMTAGTAASITPAWPPCAVVPLYAAATQTSLAGSAQGIILPPGSFSLIMQNNSGFTLTSTTKVCDYRTYNQNLNS